ncbi:DUF370 domain-containing protein [Ruminococcus gauvreauii]|uniref:DUF370 domain-containing protein n=1 Tax=Ruminococcus gauvreauii TaxID=438033 RepID=UPI00042352FA|nr:DUF370 domain-containing protein [Ruminococcus gauvreauii]
MTRLINIGFGNVINAEKIVAVVSPDAAPVKRMVQHAKENGNIIDATQGRRTKAVVITEENFVVLSALQAETISKRVNTGRTADEKGDSYEP